MFEKKKKTSSAPKAEEDLMCFFDPSSVLWEVIWRPV
jgi:hypothetical protein